MSDLISRQAAIDAIERKAYRHTYIEQIVDIINALPSAQPERKKGKWITNEKHYHKEGEQDFYYYDIRCSECGAMRKIGWIGANYCPNCGADMRGEEDE